MRKSDLKKLIKPIVKECIQESLLEDEAMANLKEQRQKMLEAIGRDSMNGVNVFEGTDPMSSSGDISSTGPKSALAGVDPKDSGVDISDLAGIYGNTWKVIKNG